MVQGRKTLCKQYKPHLVHIFYYTYNVKIHLPMISIRRISCILLLMMCCDGFCGKHAVPLHLAQKTILPLAVAPYLHK